MSDRQGRLYNHIVDELLKNKSGNSDIIHYRTIESILSQPYKEMMEYSPFLIYGITMNEFKEIDNRFKERTKDYEYSLMGFLKRKKMKKEEKTDNPVRV